MLWFHFVDLFIATYKRFDGIILPEHVIDIPKPKSSSIWPFGGSTKEEPDTCNGVKLSSFDYKTKDLKSANHKELRKDALSMHLQSKHDILVGTQPMEDPIYCVEVICTTYLSLHKFYLCYKRTYGYLCCHDWEFNETTKVQYIHACINLFITSLYMQL